MDRIKRLIAAIAFVALVPVASSFVSVPTVDATVVCGGYPYASIYEDNNFGGTWKTICSGTNYADLNLVPISGTCSGGAGVGWDDDWNNCISSVRLYQWQSTTLRLCLFNSTNFGPTPALVDMTSYGSTNSYNLTGGQSDSATSLRWVVDTNPPYACPGG